MSDLAKGAAIARHEYVAVVSKYFPNELGMF